MMRPDPDFEAWIERARGVSVERAAEIVGFVAGKGQGKRRERSGPCPVCGGTDRFSINTAKNLWNCRGCGKGGRDGVSLVMHGLKCEFVDACEAIEGPRPTPPEGESEVAREERRRHWAARLVEIAAERAAADVARDRDANAWREAERMRAHRWWRQGAPLAETPAEIYLRARGLDLPPGLRLRYHPAWTLYDGENDDGRGRVVHRGPALFAPIVEGEPPHERFLGLHTTWFDPRRPGEKVFVTGGDGRPVPAKKVRGVMAGGHIVLVRWSPSVLVSPLEAEGTTRIFVGEGIETVLSVWTALARTQSPLLAGAGFRSSVSLGNLGGKALDRLPHPTETSTDKAGRVRRVKVGGIVPDPESRAIVIPYAVDDLFLLGDGDSEPFRTNCVLARAADRHGRPGRTVRLVMAPAGRDFNDLVRAHG